MPHGLTSTQQPFNNERGSFELLDNLTTTRLFVSFSLFRPAAQWSKIHKFKEEKLAASIHLPAGPIRGVVAK